MSGLYFTEEMHAPSGATVGIFVAVRIAMKYQRRTPLPLELMRDYGMSRATAFRWVAAIKAAKGEA